MPGILTRTLTGAAVSILAGGAAAVGVATVASAHTPEVSVTCTQLHVSLTNYPAKSTVDVVLDGEDDGTQTFGPSAYDKTFPLDDTVSHDWTVTIVSGDGNTDFNRTITGKSAEDCIPSTPPATTPPATTPPTTPPATTPPATTPPTTPPATTPPTTPPATTPPTTPPATTPPTTPPATTPPTTPPATTPSTPNTPGNTTVPVPPTDTPSTPTTVPVTPAATTVPVTPSDTTTPAAVTGGTTGTGTGTGTSASGDQLAFTGSTVGLGVGVGALVTILVGGALTAIATVRRRRQSRI